MSSSQCLIGYCTAAVMGDPMLLPDGDLDRNEVTEATLAHGDINDTLRGLSCSYASAAFSSHCFVFSQPACIVPRASRFASKISSNVRCKSASALILSGSTCFPCNKSSRFFSDDEGAQCCSLEAGFDSTALCSCFGSVFSLANDALGA